MCWTRVAAEYREWRVHTSVHGIVAGLEMPFEVKHPDACHGTGLTCPLAPGPHTYTYSLFVDHNKPKVSVEAATASHFTR